MHLAQSQKADGARYPFVARRHPLRSSQPLSFPSLCQTSAHSRPTTLSIGITVCFVTAIHNRRRQLAAVESDQHRASQSVRAGSLQGVSLSGTWMILVVVGWRGELRYLQLSSGSATMLRADPSGLEWREDRPSIVEGERKTPLYFSHCQNSLSLDL